MVLARFESLLKKSIGLDAATIGPSALERAIRERERACQLDDRGAYWERLCSEQSELQALIESVVVPETWFFRDRDAFTALGCLVRETIHVRRPGRRVRILSLPCSTGEEPYSMVMAILETGVAVEGVQVDAVDVSHRALGHGHVGVYGKSSFRGSDLAFRDRYFEEIDGRHRVSEQVRRHVTFQYGNLLDPASLPGAGTYDVIFCRNVLIYFDRPTQDEATEVLSRLLAPGGVLFVGAAESGVLVNRGFVSARLPKVTAFSHAQERAATAATSTAPRAAVPAARPRIPVARSNPVVTAAPRPSEAGTRRQAIARPSEAKQIAPAPGLDAAIGLANEGRFAEAAAWCEEYLRRCPPSAEVFHLLGLVRDAAGNYSEAAAYYRKALYLDPRHHETLIHLALLLEAQNNRAEAELLRTRARRQRDADGRGSLADVGTGRG